MKNKNEEDKSDNKENKKGNKNTYYNKSKIQKILKREQRYN